MARFKFCFWLDGNKDDELLLMDDIDTLKRSRQFSSTIRDGIRLIMDLRAGNTDVLFELFPQLRTQFAQPASSGEGELRQQIESLKILILQQNSAKSTLPATGSRDRSRYSEPKDNTPELVVKKDTRTDSTQNMMNTLLAFQQ